MITNVFTEPRSATLAAVEYVCQKYGSNNNNNKYPWFNHQLKYQLSKLHFVHNLETFHPPLIIYARANNNEELKYKGYHFLISEMEKYEKLYSMNYMLLTSCFYGAVLVNLILTIYFIFRLVLFAHPANIRNKVISSCN